MEKNITNIVNRHNLTFKSNLKDWFTNNKSKIVDEEGNDVTNKFIQHMFDFPSLELTSNDFKRRERSESNVADCDRCLALKSNGARCSRRKKNIDGKIMGYCGTHLKGISNGSVEETNIVQKEKIQIWIQEINGIIRHIDDKGNIYKTDDIIDRVDSPRIIATYTQDELTGEYIINRT